MAQYTKDKIPYLHLFYWDK